MSSDELENKLLNECIDDETLLKLNILLNSGLNGLSVQEINLVTISELKRHAGVHAQILDEVLEALMSAFREEEDLEIFTSGATNILKYPELSTSENASNLLSAFEEKEGIEKAVAEADAFIKRIINRKER